MSTEEYDVSRVHACARAGNGGKSRWGGECDEMAVEAVPLVRPCVVRCVVAVLAEHGALWVVGYWSMYLLLTKSPVLYHYLLLVVSS